MSGAAGNALAVLSAVCYGASLPLSRLAYDHGTNALTVLTLRYLALILAVGLWLRLGGRSLRMPAKPILASLLVGLLFCTTSGGLLGAVVYIPVSLCVLVFYTYPMLTLVMVSAADRRPPEGRELFAVVAAFVGVAFAMDVTLADPHPAGVGFAVLAALAAASTFIVASRALPRASTTVMTWYASASAFVAGGAMTLGLDAFALPSSPLGAGLLAAVLVIFGTAIVTMLASVRLIGPVRSATLLCLEPVTAIAVAMLLLGERLSPQQWLGGALVGVAMLVATRTPGPRAKV